MIPNQFFISYNEQDIRDAYKDRQDEKPQCATCLLAKASTRILKERTGHGYISLWVYIGKEIHTYRCEDAIPTVRLFDETKYDTLEVAIEKLKKDIGTEFLFKKSGVYDDIKEVIEENMI